MVITQARSETEDDGKSILNLMISSNEECLNHGPLAKSTLPPVFVGGVLSDHSHVHLYRYSLWLLLH